MQKNKTKQKKMPVKKILLYLDCWVRELPVFNINVSVFLGLDCTSSANCGYQ